MPNATDGKTESSSLSSLCMTLTTMAGTDFSFHFFFISFIIEAISEKRMMGLNQLKTIFIFTALTKMTLNAWP